MDRTSWERTEAFLLEADVRPILSVVPDNRDPDLEIDPPDPGFWDRVRGWQERGWPIALHGYQHLSVTSSAGLVGLNPRSEFAGLPISEQESKLRRSMEIMHEDGVDPTVWAAPGHSFDMNTVEALHRIGIKVISDGLTLLPHVDQAGMFWVPQQLWRFRAAPAGLWTVCCHSNSWTDERFEVFRRRVLARRHQIVDLDWVTRTYRRRSPAWWERQISTAIGGAVRTRIRVRRWRNPTIATAPKTAVKG
jgi:hypothetical protein